MNRHEVHVFENGLASIRCFGPDTCAGETMHSRIGPDEEAKAVYLEPTRLAERLTNGNLSEPLVLFDIGMGIASNALAAIDLAGSQRSRRPLAIVSFERTLEGLALALCKPALFATQARHYETLEDLLKTGHWQSPDASIRWELRLGDFRVQSLDPAPEIIFYDFYSPRSCPELWNLGCFKRLFTACSSHGHGHGRDRQAPPPVLATYAAATSVRSSLLLAGFSVGYGARTALKTETTLATTSPGELAAPLGAAWLERVERSSRPFSADVPRTEALARLRLCEQFRGTSSAASG